MKTAGRGRLLQRRSRLQRIVATYTQQLLQRRPCAQKGNLLDTGYFCIFLEFAPQCGSVRCSVLRGGTGPSGYAAGAAQGRAACPVVRAGGLRPRGKGAGVAARRAALPSMSRDAGPLLRSAEVRDVLVAAQTAARPTTLRSSRALPAKGYSGAGGASPGRPPAGPRGSSSEFLEEKVEQLDDVPPPSAQGGIVIFNTSRRRADPAGSVWRRRVRRLTLVAEMMRTSTAVTRSSPMCRPRALSTRRSCSACSVISDTSTRKRPVVGPVRKPLPILLPRVVPARERAPPRSRTACFRQVFRQGRAKLMATNGPFAALAGVVDALREQFLARPRLRPRSGCWTRRRRSGRRPMVSSIAGCNGRCPKGGALGRQSLIAQFLRMPLRSCWTFCPRSGS